MAKPGFDGPGAFSVRDHEAVMRTQDSFTLFGYDLDELFAYKTQKVVVVKDRKLGLLRLSLLLGIFIYIFVFVLIIDGGYLESEVPVGTISTTLAKPGTFGPPVPFFVSDYSYCQTGPVIPGAFPQLPCEVWDADNVRYPSDMRDSIFLTTRVSVHEQTAACLNTTLGCNSPYVNVDAGQVIFLAGVESYTLGMTHSAVARHFYSQTGSSEFAGSSRLISGTLVGHDGKTLKKFDKGLDIISLEEILAAANQNLEEESDSSAGERKRRAGLLLVMTVEYSNRYGPPSYEYTVTAVENSEYKTIQLERVNSTSRIRYNRHGVKIVFQVTGMMYKFLFQAALIQLVSAVGLLSVATLVVEMVMLHLLPHKKDYSDAKFEETVDFSDLDAARKAAKASEFRVPAPKFNRNVNQDLLSLRTGGVFNAMRPAASEDVDYVPPTGGGGGGLAEEGKAIQMSGI